MHATVFERVYLPPKDVGGRPFVRRTVLAWEDSTTRGVVLLADDPRSDVTLPTRDALTEESAQRLFKHIGFVVESEPNEQRAWFGRDGELEIGDGNPSGPCPFTGKHAGAAIGVARDSLSDDVTCLAADYLVSARATLATGDPNRQSAVNAWLGSHPSLIADPQTIRGIRIVTQCRNEPARDAYDYCPNPASYWRESSLFAPQLRVDLSTFSVRGNVLQELLTPGSGRLYSDVPVWPTGPLHYTVFSADGRTLADSTIAAVESTPWLATIMNTAVLRPGARGRIIAPGAYFNIPRAGRHMAVMNFELLQPR